MDAEIIETGNGGDALLKGRDLSMVYGFESMVYLALWGGNVKQSTPQKRVATQQGFDYWGNSLVAPNNPSIQFNSETERMLHSTPLTSGGRLLIEGAIYQDLEFMKPFAEVKVVTQIISTDRIRIAIGVKKPDNLEQQEFIYIWDATQADLVANDSYAPNTFPLDEEGLDFELDFYL